MLWRIKGEYAILLGYGEATRFPKADAEPRGSGCPTAATFGDEHYCGSGLLPDGASGLPVRGRPATKRPFNSGACLGVEKHEEVVSLSFYAHPTENETPIGVGWTWRIHTLGVQQLGSVEQSCSECPICADCERRR